MSAAQAQLGDRAKDAISGFEGIVVAVTNWLYGCRRITLAPEKLDKDGKIVETCTFDDDQIRVLQVGAQPGPSIREQIQAALSIKTTGGPDRHEERR